MGHGFHGKLLEIRKILKPVKLPYDWGNQHPLTGYFNVNEMRGKRGV
jgi:hypothetical protein